MKKKIAYAVFTTTDSGADYMVKGNFGEDQEEAQTWAENHANDYSTRGGTYPYPPLYPNGLFVKEVKY